jgi:hypothetical protein
MDFFLFFFFFFQRRDGMESVLCCHHHHRALGYGMFLLMFVTLLPAMKKNKNDGVRVPGMGKLNAPTSFHDCYIHTGKMGNNKLSVDGRASRRAGGRSMSASAPRCDNV